ncbi:hypothetical protein [Halorubrum vacuolatum]|uniref:Uncharacterized protein n=1 Tax=Halorubrum vacuolatum TaxID=63740 RepID=A0A238W471_HALVU|nr:hypothetical protein [Halorubrum vacuolatum]SNR41350.1 hypothetical protein SAMN06264855_105108 [Halorubrum vacuolatum]
MDADRPAADPERFDAIVGALALPFVFIMAIALALGRFFGSIAVGALVGLLCFAVIAIVRVRLFPI